MAETKRVYFLQEEIKEPPFSHEARLETGFLIRKLQEGEMLTMPDSRQMPEVGPGCHELRIRDSKHNIWWRIMYCLTPSLIIILGIIGKKTNKTPQRFMETCKRRLKEFTE